MRFDKGNKFGKGRPRGSGKRQNISALFQCYLAGKEGARTRLELAMERMFNDDLKTFFAYAYGKPTEVQTIQNPDGPALIPESAIEAARAIAKTL